MLVLVLVLPLPPPLCSCRRGVPDNCLKEILQEKQNEARDQEFEFDVAPFVNRLDTRP